MTKKRIPVFRWLLGAVLVPPAVLSLSTPASAAPAPACTDVATSAAAATSLATACGRAVEIVAARTESTETLANPDGSRTLRTYAQPQRVRRGDGSWAPVDPTLRKDADGSLTPVASTAGLRFSGGGSGPLVELERGGKSLRLWWPAALPAPVVSGADATYPEVLPGVDLRVAADIEGFSQVLIVKNRAAAANPALRRIALRSEAGGLRLATAANGSITAKDSTGAVVFASSGAFAWDSPAPAAVAARASATAKLRAAGKQAPGSSDEPVPPAHQSAMPVEVAGSQVAVRPPAALLTGADTQFPLYLDPAFSGTGYKWTQTNRNSPDTSYWTRNRDYMRVGKEWQTSNVWRTFLRFDNLQPLYGSTIISASVFVTLYHSASCYASPVELWHTKYVDDIYSNSWNLTTGHWISPLQAVNANANKAACPQPNANVEFGAGSVTNEVQALANSSTWHIDLGLKAQNEGDDYQWKKFLPGGAHLDVVYNRYPNVPGPQALSSVTDCYQQCASPAISRSTTPTLGATVSDPDGGSMAAWFEVWDAAETTQIAAAPQVNTTSGNTASWAVPAGKLVNGNTYHWRVRDSDEAGWFSGWSPWQVVTVDTAAPPPPAITSAQFPAKAWGAAVGTAGTFALTSAGSDATAFQWSVDAGPVTTVAATGTTTRTASAAYTAATDMVHTLHVKALDAAGNTTGTVDHQFWVSPSANRYSHWTFDEGAGTTVADSGGGGSSLSPLKLSGAAAFGPGYPSGSALALDGGAVSTTAGVIDTTKSFTVMAWVKPATTDGYETVLSQDGASASRFVLRYDKDANGGAGGWCFGLRAADTTAEPTYACATGAVGSSHPPTDGEWVHLAGIYDAVTGVIQIHVMGNQESCDGEMAQAPFTANWSATGAFVVGRALTGGAAADAWHGSVDEVWAYQRRLAPVEICQQASQ